MAATPAAAKTKDKSTSCATVTEAQVASQFDKFNAAWATKNPDTVTKLFTDDAVLLATVSNKPRTDHAEIKDYFVGFLKGSPVGTITSSTIDIGCNKATRVGTWTVTLTDAATGAKTDVKARYSFVYRLDGGEWKIDHLHSSMLPETAGK
ncbi:MAG: SgcJ/EcaC family oxidoreductase [Sphingopyxis sp.]|nr:SgcJ/EcaC family oxidoreductase [Sphingopyxis sp.]